MAKDIDGSLPSTAPNCSRQFQAKAYSGTNAQNTSSGFMFDLAIESGRIVIGDELGQLSMQPRALLRVEVGLPGGSGNF